MARRALVDIWEAMGRPQVPLGPGVYVRELERWLAGEIASPAPEDIELVRETLDRWRDSWEYLTGRETLEKYLNRTRGVT